MERANVLIAGAGVIGSAIACALTERGVRDVCVVDLDLSGRYASSELNAGGARATWWQEVNVAACRDTLAFFDEHAAEIAFRRTGYLWLYADRALWARAGERRALQERLGVTVDLLEPSDVARRFPLVDRNLDELVGATHSPGDGLLNPNALRRLYQERAIAGGARFLQRHYLDGIEVSERSGGVREVERVHFTEVAKGEPADEARVIERILTQHRSIQERRSTTSRSARALRERARGVEPARVWRVSVVRAFPNRCAASSRSSTCVRATSRRAATCAPHR